ncbi:MAG: hypothetical protein COW42_14720 [Deltaproteobacteria bacterium CG17_big_fil_post_rev_8_21_14_2_50_63_7]|nr:MAG: hypothetical protein COW42_14720 [Deltaproteobacteria bacterium CG17_big_fil_post_rev_8_21_14_2_50_63_7]
MVQAAPSTHAAQVPAQSTSLSPPFFTPSSHAAVRQLPVAVSQTPEAQSVPAWQETETSLRSVVSSSWTPGDPSTQAVRRAAKRHRWVRTGFILDSWEAG